MKITRRQIRNLIREAIEVHLAPENLESMDPHEAYGLGYDAAWQFHSDHDVEGDPTYMGVISEKDEAAPFGSGMKKAKLDKDKKKLIGHT
jgi:hypothetical protein